MRIVLDSLRGERGIAVFYLLDSLRSVSVEARNGYCKAASTHNQSETHRFRAT